METIDRTLQTVAQPVETTDQDSLHKLPRPFFSPTLFSRKPSPEAPNYLDTYYWWAYVEPRGVRFFERDWLINLILCGNYKKLRDCALSTFGAKLPGKTLQITCCYGNLTPRLAERAAAGRGSLDVIDIMPVQLENLSAKLTPMAPAKLQRMDSRALNYADGEFDRVLLFFLLHEQPQDSRERSLQEALRVLKPGGKLVIVDYGRPKRWHPLRYLLLPFLKFLEPFAVPLWQEELTSLLARHFRRCVWHKTAYFGGLYQKITVTKA
ncbi:MAG: rhodoquinone biosynthesis methyltransferase RquA [Alphaproteobacteria bacterium]